MASSDTSQKDLFAEAVSCVFKEWQALRIIVDNLFGGPHTVEKAKWLEEVTAGFVSSNADIQHWELEDYLATIMDQEFHTTVDDASLPCIAKKICDLHAKMANGRIDDVRAFIAGSKPAVTVEVKCVEQESLEEHEVEGLLEDIEEDEEVDQSMEQLSISDYNEEQVDKKHVDEEGWEVVKRGRRKSKSNA